MIHWRPRQLTALKEFSEEVYWPIRLHLSRGTWTGLVLGKSVLYEPTTPMLLLVGWHEGSDAPGCDEGADDSGVYVNGGMAIGNKQQNAESPSLRTCLEAKRLAERLELLERLLGSRYLQDCLLKRALSFLLRPFLKGSLSFLLRPF